MAKVTIIIEDMPELGEDVISTQYRTENASGEHSAAITTAGIVAAHINALFNSHLEHNHLSDLVQ